MTSGTYVQIEAGSGVRYVQIKAGSDIRYAQIEAGSDVRTSGTFKLRPEVTFRLHAAGLFNYLR